MSSCLNKLFCQCWGKSEVKNQLFHRLPTNAIPTHYDLVINPNFEDFTFDGKEAIKIELTKESPVITLNSAEIWIKSAIWEDANNKQETEVNVIKTEELMEVTHLLFNPPLPKGKGILTLEFKGSINDKLKGFYRSRVKGSDGKFKYNGLTQFEPTDARRCFPCWDEPAHKATFDITLIVEKDQVALSNMPLKENLPYEKDPKRRRMMRFERSPIMSTYLVAFVIGDFEYIEKTSSDGVLCRVYTSPGKKEQGSFALDVVARVLPYYKEYFKVAYPLPKMDLVAVADFSPGAMENWGLVLYRENCLLIDEDESSASSRQWVSIIVCHEAAHQWFGNLVTMDWWTHLWLNEGYANFSEYLSVDYLFPEFDIWTQFITDNVQGGLQLDSLKSSHPIEVTVGHPAEAEEIFDAISYNKGAAIIRMLHRYIGDGDFREGMRIYLTRHQYSNTATEDLWKALEEASGKPVGQVMGTWTKQMGFPLIRVTSKEEGNTRVLNLSQEKFWADPAFKNSKEHKKYQWMIPILFCAASNPQQVSVETLMKDKTTTVRLPGVQSSDWVKLNPGVVGFYRVHYPSEVLTKFIPAIKEKKLNPTDRLGLLDDLFAMVQSGESSTIEVLEFLEAYRNEDNFSVWSCISNVIGRINLLFAYTDYHDKLKIFSRRIFSIIYGKLGWDAKKDESHVDTLLRSVTLSRLSSLEDENTSQESKRRFDLHIKGEQTIAADLRVAVYKSVLTMDGEIAFNTLIKMYEESESSEEKQRIANSLAGLRDPILIKKALDFAISDKVRKQDSILIIASIGLTKQGREIAWQFFKDEKKTFQDQLQGYWLISKFVTVVCGNFVTEDKAREVVEFFKKNDFPGTERVVEQAVENIRINEKWLKRDKSALEKYLNEKNLPS